MSVLYLQRDQVLFHNTHHVPTVAQTGQTKTPALRGHVREGEAILNLKFKLKLSTFVQLCAWKFTRPKHFLLLAALLVLYCHINKPLITKKNSRWGHWDSLKMSKDSLTAHITHIQQCWCVRECVCVCVWWMIQLTQMEHRCTMSIPHALWSSNRQLLMHSLMRLRLTKRMVIVNNAGTYPAPSSATRTAERKKQDALQSRGCGCTFLFSWLQALLRG